ncbi:MAG: peptide ABC transporter substrate-binding protein [Verrucomicrobiota bacterium]|jgi:oligopeptide transport system substrate-binding protein
MAIYFLLTRVAGTAAMAACLVVLTAGCGRRETLVEVGDREGMLRIGNGAEPAGLDPQVETGEPEHDIMITLYEGLVDPDPKDASPVPGVAERWDISPDGKVYTFHLRKNARWSNGNPVTSRDFLESYHRILLPALGAQYSYMLYPVTNAEAFNLGKITNYDQVGFKAPDDYTFVVTLSGPTPYLPAMMVHNAWYPVPIATIKKYGAWDDPTNPWAKPGRFVGNGPFLLTQWKINSHILVERNPYYWDAKNVRLNSIYFDPEESYDTAERMFRSGQLHTDLQAPPSKVAFYRKYKPGLLNDYPLLSTYYYRFNVTRPPLNDKRVRQALAMSIDRRAICETVARAGEMPAFCLTPPNTAGYTAKAQLKEDPAAARQLLAEAGYPDGKNFPTIEVLFNTGANHKPIAEALQQMWKKNLNINVTLHNEEWKVYLDSTQHLDYFIARAGWGADYDDPSSFLELSLTGGGNNETGWGNPEYDRLVEVQSRTQDQGARFDAYQKAEAILMDEMPILPIYFYTRPRLIVPDVKNWFPNLLDIYDYKQVWLEPQK